MEPKTAWNGQRPKSVYVWQSENPEKTFDDWCEYVREFYQR